MTNQVYSDQGGWRLITKTVFLAGLFVLSACGPAPEMPKNESASIEMLNRSDVKRFASLSLRGDLNLKEKLWTGETWPLNQGSINRRWLSHDPGGFYHEPPGKEELFWLTQDEINQLSPSEKFDILLGRYHYPLKEEVASFADPRATDHMTLLEGWILSTLFHQEPTPKTLTNPDGIVVSFGSSDIKGLLAYFYKSFHDTKIVSELGKTKEINPGTFHVVLANKVFRNEPFIIDNFPVLGYVSRVDQESTDLSGTPPGTVKVLSVRTKVTFLSHGHTPTMNPVRGTELQLKTGREFSYWLFVNPFGEIVGGEWQGEERPRHLWETKKSTAFNGLLQGLEILLND